MRILEQFNNITLQQIQIEQEITTMFFIIEEAKGTVLNISQGTVKVL